MLKKFLRRWRNESRYTENLNIHNWSQFFLADGAELNEQTNEIIVILSEFFELGPNLDMGFHSD